MKYYKRYFESNIPSRGWDYYRVHSDGCFDYWNHSYEWWSEPIFNCWGLWGDGEAEEISLLEIIIVLGAKALGQLSFAEEQELDE
jgi:hypothetical protein